MVQRGVRYKDKLDAEKIKRLDELGFVWEPDQQFWESQFQELVSYKKEHGDCLVPDRWRENKRLAAWVNSQRTQKNKGELDAEKIKKLDELGFVWNALEQLWEDRFQELVSYKKEHGDCLVPQSWKENKPLGSWVKTQRKFRKKDKLDAEKIKRLDELGFIWEPDQQFWENRFQELVSYKKEHGDCLVPQSWKENKQLASWVKNQRTFRKEDKLDAQRIKRLDELGFVWEPDKQAWENRFQELVSYRKEHGDCLVPRGWQNKKLANWVMVQRGVRYEDKLDAEKIKRLNELGFVWSLQD